MRPWTIWLPGTMHFRTRSRISSESWKGLALETYTMVHDHKLGSCSGILKFNAYAVSYVPSGGSGDGFAESLNSIVLNDEGERLKISYRDKTLRFRSENGKACPSHLPAINDPDD